MPEEYKKRGPYSKIPKNASMITVFEHPDVLHQSGYDHEKMITFRTFCEKEKERITALGVKCAIINQYNSDNIGLCRME